MPKCEKMVKKTTGESMKWIICFSPMMFKVLFVTPWEVTRRYKVLSLDENNKIIRNFIKSPIRDYFRDKASSLMKPK